MRSAVGHPDHKDSVEYCADQHIPQKDDLCGYKRWQAGAKGCGQAYSPECVEGGFSEVRQDFIANSLRAAQMLIGSNEHEKDRCERTER